MILTLESSARLNNGVEIPYLGLGVSLPVTVTDPLEALSSFKPHFYDLLLVDINMPKMNGFELCSRILKIDVNVRIPASAKIKTDKLDALKLANLLRGGYIAECYVPDRKIMDLRELVRHRFALVRIRTRMKNKIHGITLMRGVRITDDVHPFSHMYIEKLKGMNDYRINGYLRIIES